MAVMGFVARRAGQGLGQFFGTFVLTGFTIALTLGVFGGFLLLQSNSIDRLSFAICWPGSVGRFAGKPEKLP